MVAGSFAFAEMQINQELMKKQNANISITMQIVAFRSCSFAFLAIVSFVSHSTFTAFDRTEMICERINLTALSMSNDLTFFN